jgi:predicted phosphodiesterase
LRRLPNTHRIDLEDGSELLLIHGSPGDPFEPFSHDMTDEEMSALLSDDPADIIVCGGSHVHFDRMIAGVRIINVGSVGEAPSGTERGGQHADFTIIDTHKAGIEVEQLVVPLGKAASNTSCARFHGFGVPNEYVAQVGWVWHYERAARR